VDLSRIALQPRLRNGWEAIDLGFMMARRWWWQLFFAWTIPGLILFCLLSGLFYEQSWVAIFVVWWLKPLWDRLPLYVASRQLFGEHVSYKHLISVLWQTLKRDCLAWLTWRRLSLTRAFDMPVTILEALTGNARVRRLAVLHKNSTNAATWLTITCIHMEWVIGLGLIGLLYILIPNEFDMDFGSLWTRYELHVAHATSLLSFFAMALVAPFYTMAGFALYISRRVELEGWDIEIRFRHLAAQHGNKRANRGTPSMVMLAFCVAVFSLSTPTSDALANSNDDEQPLGQATLSPQHSRQIINEILLGESFHHVIDKSGWRVKDKKQRADGDIPDWLIWLVEALEQLFDFDRPDIGKLSITASVLEFVLWVVMISFVIYLIYRYRETLAQWMPRTSIRSPAQPPPPEILFGLDVAHDSLPVDVAADGLDLWHAGRHRAAMSLLYRATLYHLMHDFSFRFYDSHTETECAAIVAVSSERRVVAYMDTLTHSWQRLAYGHRMPPDSQFRVLCQQWREIFQREK